ncbi:hypothetical protein Patl1_02570 [Pistacia atlantica]|uniref:Uncharacterized protein n=1 Tax=Pistacia atlantica TaxID=434234 RepID=A0ACC1CD68_9ROSI|nr:hypothetical protein Patl1_02570 [Pistacia atlantica]
MSSESQSQSPPPRDGYCATSVSMLFGSAIHLFIRCNSIMARELLTTVPVTGLLLLEAQYSYKYDEEKIEFFTGESNSDAKIARPEACGVNKVCTCRRCKEKADGKDCLVCDSMYHVSCVEPAVKEIPPKSWYCVSCAAKGIGLPHENCLVCERLNDEILDACF